MGSSQEEVGSCSAGRRGGGGEGWRFIGGGGDEGPGNYDQSPN